MSSEETPNLKKFNDFLEKLPLTNGLLRKTHETLGLYDLNYYHNIYLVTVTYEDFTQRTFNYNGSVNSIFVERIHDWYLTEEESIVEMDFLIENSTYGEVMIKELSVSHNMLREVHFGKSIAQLITLPWKSKASMWTIHYRSTDTGELPF